MAQNFAKSQSTPQFKVGFFFTSLPANAQTVLLLPFSVAVTFNAGLPNAKANSAAAATGSSVFTILKNGVSIGTFTFAPAATSATFSFTTAVTFSVGDIMTITAPALQDATLSGIGVMFQGISAS